MWSRSVQVGSVGSPTSRTSRQQVIFGDRLGEVGPLHSCPACGRPWECLGYVGRKSLGLRKHGAERACFFLEAWRLTQPTARYARLAALASIYCIAVLLRQPRCFFACVSYRWPIAPSAAPSSEKVLQTWSYNVHAEQVVPKVFHYNTLNHPGMKSVFPLTCWRFNLSKVTFDFAEQRVTGAWRINGRKFLKAPWILLRVAVWPRPGIDLFNHDAHAHLGERGDGLQLFMHSHGIYIWNVCLYRRHERWIMMGPWNLQTSSPLSQELYHNNSLWQLLELAFWWFCLPSRGY